ncbi:HNH endonuclease [Propionibacteriaceae bacterium Y2011]
MSCTIPGCDHVATRRGWCDTHYRQRLRAGQLDQGTLQRAPRNATPVERLEHRGWDVTPTGCWELRTTTTRPHPRIKLAGRTWAIASRVAYEAWVGPIPDGLCVLHRCDNPPCVNPGHLFLGTRTDNSVDKVTKRRAPNGERMRHKLTDVQVAEIRTLHESGSSQATLARRFGVSSGHVSQIVNGKTRVEVTRPRR